MNSQGAHCLALGAVTSSRFGAFMWAIAKRVHRRFSLECAVAIEQQLVLFCTGSVLESTI